MAAPETAPASPILTESFQENPYPVIHSLRKDDPVHWVPLGFWFVTRHDDIKYLYACDEATPDRRVWEFYVPPRTNSCAGPWTARSSRLSRGITRACASSCPPR